MNRLKALFGALRCPWRRAWVAVGMLAFAGGLAVGRHSGRAQIVAELADTLPNECNPGVKP
jgi:hypothetical protein